MDSEAKGMLLMFLVGLCIVLAALWARYIEHAWFVPVILGGCVLSVGLGLLIHKAYAID
jgi:hypothetical protein